MQLNNFGLGLATALALLALGFVVGQIGGRSPLSAGLSPGVSGAIADESRRRDLPPSVELARSGELSPQALATPARSSVDLPHLSASISGRVLLRGYPAAGVLVSCLVEGRIIRSPKRRI